MIVISRTKTTYAVRNVFIWDTFSTIELTPQTIRKSNKRSSNENTGVWPAYETVILCGRSL